MIKAIFSIGEGLEKLPNVKEHANLNKMYNVANFDKEWKTKSKTRESEELKVKRGIAQSGSASALGANVLPPKYKLKHTT